MKRIFVTGISTEVGKTIASAVIAEALEADYWKPVQAGDTDNTDSMKVRSLLTNTKTIVHDSAYLLNTPMSPHAAAAIDGIHIRTQAIREPDTENHLVIEGAGGLLVPLNDQETIMDLILPRYSVILVSRHYLGSINHTLLSLEVLRNRGHQVSLLFVGDEHPTTEEIIRKKTEAGILGRIPWEKNFGKKEVLKNASALREMLQSL